MDHYSAIPTLALENAQPHFDGDYIYAGTSAYALTSKLLSEAEREKIIGAPTVADLIEVLRGTFFGTYFAGDTRDVDQALSKAMVEAKKNLDRLSSNPHLLSILWLRYDFYNLKILMKHNSPEYDSTSEDSFIPLGLHSFAIMERAVKSSNAAALHNTLSSSITGAPKNLEALDAYLDARYLEAALYEAEQSDEPFAVQYVRLRMNLFVILSGLRAHTRGESPIHIASSDFSERDIANPELLLARLSHMGFSRHWATAIERYRSTNDFSELDRAADEFVMKWLKRQSISLNSPAPLFAYWHVFRENVQLIRAAHTARKVGMNEKTLREIIRTSYNTYAY